MAIELVRVSTCDGCMVFDGERVTEGVETIGVPRTKVELESCPACRERLQPLFDLILKRGRVGETPGPSRTVGRARPTQLSALTEGLDGQDWTPMPAPDDLACTVCGEVQKSKSAWSVHMAKHHPEQCRTCVVPDCGTATTGVYSHYVRYHPDAKRPAGAWRP